MLLEALSLGVLTQLGLITVPWVMALAAFFGLLVAFEVPTRQAFVMDLVGKADVMNAIALNSSAFNVSRVIGPVIAGAVIAAIGIAACFFLNALSFVAVLGTLAYMRLPAVPPTTERRNAAEAFREGFRYVSRERWPRTLVLLTATLSVFGFSFLVMLPVFARDVLGVGAGGYGAALVGLALIPWLPLTLLVCVLAGCAMASAGITTNTLLQRLSPDHLRGRVMGFYSFVALGMAPMGALQAGWVSEHLGVRTSFAVGGTACMLAVALVVWRFEAERKASPVTAPIPAPGPPQLP
jgi:MFS family permease